MSINHRTCRPLAFAILATMFAVDASAANAQSLEQIERDYLRHIDNGDFRDAAKVAQRGLEVARRVAGNDAETMATVYYYLGSAQRYAGRYSEAEKSLEQALRIARRAFGETDDAAEIRLELGGTLHDVGRYAEAEPYFQQALRTFQRSRNQEGIAWGLYSMGRLHMEQARFAEAETLLHRSLEIAKRELDRADVAWVYDALTDLCLYQGRVEDAAPHANASLQIRFKEMPKDHIALAASYWGSAWLFAEQKKYAAAEKYYKFCLKVVDKKLGKTSRYAAELRFDVGAMYHAQGKFADAERLYKDCLVAANQIMNGKDHPQAVWVYNALADLYLDQGKLDEARAMLDEASLLGTLGAGLEKRYETSLLSAELAWKQKSRGAAVSYIREAMRLSEQQRTRAGGAEHQRTKYFGRFAAAYERMVAFQTEIGDVNAALNAMERSRARSLIEQMTVQGVDLLEGVDQTLAVRLRREERQAREKVAMLEARLRELNDNDALSPSQKEAQARGILLQLRDARAEFVRAYASIRNASPAYRLAIGQDNKPITLGNLQDLVADRDGLLLEYMFGEEGGYLIVVPAEDDPQLIALNVTEEQSRILGIAPGPLTADKLHQALTTKGNTGVLDHLRNAVSVEAADVATPGLHALWNLLVPPAQQAALEGGKVKRLLIVPDGPLAMLPFEALVVNEAGPTTKYLLDVGPPTIYAPSATILNNVLERQKWQQRLGVKPVLSVADPRYASAQSAASRSSASVSSRRRYSLAGGKLERLPFTGQEAEWIREVFAGQGVGIDVLKRGDASEAKVSSNTEGRWIVHMACHGVVDQKHGNLFGALALTAGDAGNPSDDGFLTLSEIYKLNLKGCELAILSACSTNFGPQQHGEGVWALSRGFLVGGARRVVASNWPVDDEAAASLVSYFCGGLALADGKHGRDAVDYAEALHAARRFVRHKEQWKSPFYWASFVMVGPN